MTDPLSWPFWKQLLGSLTLAAAIFAVGLTIFGIVTGQIDAGLPIFVAAVWVLAMYLNHRERRRELSR